MLRKLKELLKISRLSKIARKGYGTIPMKCSKEEELEAKEQMEYIYSKMPHLKNKQSKL